MGAAETAPGFSLSTDGTWSTSMGWGGDFIIISLVTDTPKCDKVDSPGGRRSSPHSRLSQWGRLSGSWGLANGLGKDGSLLAATKEKDDCQDFIKIQRNKPQHQLLTSRTWGFPSNEGS